MDLAREAVHDNLLTLNLLCIPFLLLLTHPQALSLRLQPELLGRNIQVQTLYRYFESL